MSNLAPGLVDSEPALVAIWLLDWTFDYVESKPSIIPSPADCVEHSGNSELRPNVEANLAAALGILADKGLLKSERAGLGGRYESALLRLQDRGSDLVLKRRGWRQDAARRRQACREALLRWLYQKDSTGVEAPAINGLFSHVLGHFEGDPFTQTDVDEASGYLRDNDLIQGHGAWGAGVLRPRITSEGKDVIERFEGALIDYLNRDQGAKVVNQTHFNAEVSGQVAWGNQDVHQEMHKGIDTDSLLVLLQAIRDEADSLGLDEEDAAEAVSLTEQAEREAQKDSPDKNWVKQLLSRAKGILGKSERAVATLLVASIDHFVGSI